MKTHEIIQTAVRAELTDKERIRVASLGQVDSYLPRFKLFDPQWLIYGASAAALVLVLSLGIFKFGNLRQADTDTPAISVPAFENPITVEGVESPVVETPIFGGFVLTAYAAAVEGQVLTPEFMSATVPTTLQVEAKVMLASYSPLMGSVPGLPFTIEAAAGDCAIQVSVDNGTLCKWDIQIYVVTEFRDTTIASKGETLYWSPLQGNGQLAEGATITVTAVDGDKVLATQDIIITQQNDGFYATVGQQHIVTE